MNPPLRPEDCMHTRVQHDPETGEFVCKACGFRARSYATVQAAIDAMRRKLHPESS